MAWPVTINGRTYTAADFEPYNYARSFPDMMADLTVVAGQLLSAVAAAGQFLGVGQCTFKYINTTTCRLLPGPDGNMIRVNGALYEIPAAGITFTNSGLSAGQFRYAYVSVSGGTLVGSWSATGHVTDSAAHNIGTEVMSGNAGMTLVGCAYLVTGGVFYPSCVRSWYNDKGVSDIGTTVKYRTSKQGVGFGYAEVDLSLAVLNGVGASGWVPGSANITVAGNDFAVDDQIYFTKGQSGALPTGITDGQTYYIKNVGGGGADTFQISLTSGGAAITPTGTAYTANWVHKLWDHPPTGPDVRTAQTEDRRKFVSWANELVDGVGWTNIFSNTAGAQPSVTLNFDPATATPPEQFYQTPVLVNADTYTPVTIHYPTTQLSEGYHEMGLMLLTTGITHLTGTGYTNLGTGGSWVKTSRRP